jgi:hypothetical protein
MAAAPPPHEPNVEIRLFVTDDEFDALERLANDRRVSPQVALREALASAVAVQHLIADGCTIFYRRPDGAEGQIIFD